MKIICWFKKRGVTLCYNILNLLGVYYKMILTIFFGLISSILTIININLIINEIIIKNNIIIPITYYYGIGIYLLFMVLRIPNKKDEYTYENILIKQINNIFYQIMLLIISFIIISIK